MASERLVSECTDCGCPGGAAPLVEDDRGLSLTSSLLRHSEPGRTTGLAVSIRHFCMHSYCSRGEAETLMIFRPSLSLCGTAGSTVTTLHYIGAGTD